MCVRKLISTNYTLYKMFIYGLDVKAFPREHSNTQGRFPKSVAN